MDYLLGHLSDDTYVQDLEGAVNDARQHNEWRREYMTLEMKYQEKYLEGKEDGKIEEIVFDGFIIFADFIQQSLLPQSV